jgi:hypothetical protein
MQNLTRQKEKRETMREVRKVQPFLNDRGDGDRIDVLPVKNVPVPEDQSS